MKSAATIFLACFVALSASWGGFVLAPQIQLGREAQVKPFESDSLYPPARPGLARRGAEVYRSLGCAYCHSQNVGQEGAACEVFLSQSGTNEAATLAAVKKVNPALAIPETLAGLPKTIATYPDVASALPLLKALAAVKGKAAAVIVAQGPDISRNWGLRHSVAQDFLVDDVVQMGTYRHGPDLANLGLRKPDPEWHLRHLYAPQSEVHDSTMPAYRFLFTKAKAGAPGATPLAWPAAAAPAPGYVIVPTDDARALAAYLVSLRADAYLPEAPCTVPVPPAPATNAPAQ